MAIVASYDWESDTWTHNDDNPARTAWRDAVAEVAEKAQAALPECNSRIAKAVAIVLNGDVELLEGGKAKVASQANGTTEYFVVNGTCSCPDFPKAPQSFCKHRLSLAIHKRAMMLAKQRLSQLDSASNGTSQPRVQPRVLLEQPHAENLQQAQGIDPRWITHLHGKPFVRYAGLLALAHERGLQSLEVSFLHVTATLVTAQATAVFTDGRRFTECADASPEDVPFHLKPHFARMALTRCKARALRDALNIGLTALEEIDAE